MDIVKEIKSSYLRVYVNYFLPRKGLQAIIASTEDEVRSVYNTRWRVYVDSGYIKPEEYPEKVFKDDYDPYSVQFLVMNNGDPAGSVRLVLNSKIGFPIEAYYNVTLPEDRDKGAEISRLGVLPNYRGGKRSTSLSLLHAAYEWSKEKELKYWYAFMPEKLISAFSGFGAVFHELSQDTLQEYHKEARAPMLGYFKKTQAKPYILYLDELNKNLRNMKINW